ncbi:MAG TPA: N-acetylmuramoyl-L-alanine amidase, partial [Thermoanaerobaculia bacterium]
MRKWWVVLGFLFLSFPALGASRTLSVSIDSDISASLGHDQEIVVRVKPRRGDAWTRLALRVAGDAGRWKEIAKFNRMGATLMSDRAVRVPFAMLKPALQREVIAGLFPTDSMSERGWVHRVVLGNGVEGESLWKIAEWFTGDGANYAAIRAANGARPLSTHVGDEIVIPRGLLTSPFASIAPQIAETPAQVEDDPEPERIETSDAAVLPATAPISTEPVSLDYLRASEQPYAVYRLRRGEALYSSVVIRFTGRLFAKDVNEVVDQIVAFNGIGDVSKLPVGYPVKIPMELLTAEHRPLDDPRRIEFEQSKRESARLAHRVEAKNLDGVHIILDAGHGGRDVGTTHGSVWESIYVYDVACRLKKILEEKTGANVWMTTRSAGAGFEIPKRDLLANQLDHFVLTTPKYQLDDSVIGVNLRWYLANSILQRALRNAVQAEKVIFLSIHADSLHPALRGAMAYIPGERHVQGTFTKSGQVYLARAEVREQPTVRQTREEALRAEGLSRELAESIIESFR